MLDPATRAVHAGAHCEVEGLCFFLSVTSIHTGSRDRIVTPAADIPRLALASGALVVHVNTADVSQGEHNEIMLIGNATDVLVQLSRFLEDVS